MTQQNVDALMRDYAGDAPGASVVVVHHDKVVFQKSYGMANREERIASSPATHYRLASVTKQFTAAAILTLADRGKLSLDDPIRKYLPSLPPYADAITIRQLLTHTSGLIDYEDIIPEGTTKQLKDVDVLRLLEMPHPTYFAPGDGYRYSNTGYAFLALIVERVSGLTFAEFLRSTIFVPLHMNSSVAHEEGISTVSNRAYGYSRDGESWTRTDQSTTSAVLGDGGIYTSVEELVNWIRALDRGSFADAAIPRVATGHKGTWYGFGWRVEDGVVSHTGETRGFRNALIRFPDEKLSVVVLTNRNEGEPYDTAMKIAGLFRNGTRMGK